MKKILHWVGFIIVPLFFNVLLLYFFDICINILNLVKFPIKSLTFMQLKLVKCSALTFTIINFAFNDYNFVQNLFKFNKPLHTYTAILHIYTACIFLLPKVPQINFLGAQFGCVAHINTSTHLHIHSGDSHQKHVQAKEFIAYHKL